MRASTVTAIALFGIVSFSIGYYSASKDLIGRLFPRTSYSQRFRDSLRVISLRVPDTLSFPLASTDDDASRIIYGQPEIAKCSFQYIGTKWTELPLTAITLRIRAGTAGNGWLSEFQFPAGGLDRGNIIEFPIFADSSPSMRIRFIKDSIPIDSEGNVSSADLPENWIRVEIVGYCLANGYKTWGWNRRSDGNWHYSN